jgi:peptidoglycan/LPS O-acetylase OafA/YrhL
VHHQNKLVELESIRGLAAILVLFFHIPAWNARIYEINAIRNGYLMVDLFFALSGFVMYRQTAFGRCGNWLNFNFSDLVGSFQYTRFS